MLPMFELLLRLPLDALPALEGGGTEEGGGGVKGRPSHSALSMSLKIYKEGGQIQEVAVESMISPLQLYCYTCP